MIPYKPRRTVPFVELVDKKDVMPVPGEEVGVTSSPTKIYAGVVISSLLDTVEFTASKVKELTKFRHFFDLLGFCKEACLEATKSILQVAKTYQ